MDFGGCIATRWDRWGPTTQDRIDDVGRFGVSFPRRQRPWVTTMQSRTTNIKGVLDAERVPVGLGRIA